MLQNAPRHSAIILTFIKLLLSLKSLFCLVLSDCLAQVLLYRVKKYDNEYIKIVSLCLKYGEWAK